MLTSGLLGALDLAGRSVVVLLVRLLLLLLLLLPSLLLFLLLLITVDYGQVGVDFGGEHALILHRASTSSGLDWLRVEIGMPAIEVHAISIMCSMDYSRPCAAGSLHLLLPQPRRPLHGTRTWHLASTLRGNNSVLLLTVPLYDC